MGITTLVAFFAVAVLKEISLALIFFVQAYVSNLEHSFVFFVYFLSFLKRGELILDLLLFLNDGLF